MRNLANRLKLASVILLCGFPLMASSQSAQRDPFAQSPAMPYKAPHSSAAKSCDANFRLAGILMLESAAARDECAVSHMPPIGGFRSRAEREAFEQREGFNAACGARLSAAAGRGEYRLSSTPHRFEVVVLEGWNERLVFSGTVIGDRLTANDENRALIWGDGRAVIIPDAYTAGVVLVRFVDPRGVNLPPPSGAGKPIEAYKRGCGISRVIAIEAEARTP